MAASKRNSIEGSPFTLHQPGRHDRGSTSNIGGNRGLERSHGGLPRGTKQKEELREYATDYG